MLTANEIHCSYVNMNRIMVPMKIRLSCLSESEKKHAEKFHRPEDNEHYITRRWFYRQVLAKYSDVPPEALQFVENNYGKPNLQSGQNREGISFSCSSSADMAAIALVKDREIGIDIEFIQQNLKISQVSGQIFTRQEQELIENSGNSAQVFFELWTKKEAFAKAAGKGLVYANPGRLDLTPDMVKISENGMTKYLHFKKLSIAPNYAGSIALMSDSMCVPVSFQIQETKLY